MNTLLIVAALLIGNLAENPSFEAVDEQGVPLEWRGGYNAKVISLDADKPFHGQVCMRFALDGKETMLGQGGYFKLIPGKTYTFSTYVRANHDIAALQIQLINLGWSWSTPSRLALTNTQGKWQRFERTFVVPAPEAHPYQGRPNDDYQIVVYAKGVSGDVWIDALQLEEGDKATAFKGLDTHDPIANEILGRSFERPAYYKLADPLYEQLLSDEPGPDRALYWGYDDLWPDDTSRPYAKKFAHRYVHHEQVAVMRSLPIVPMTNAWPRGGADSYPTCRMILRHDNTDVAPVMIDGKAWIMHPLWQDAYLKRAVELAELADDPTPGNIWGNTWGLFAGDEMVESFAYKVVPPEKRDDTVRAIDQAVREQFGYGKWGMPESDKDDNPFRRIAYRRWVNAEINRRYRQVYEQVKKINPNLIMLGPDPSGAVPPLDYEGMADCFDLMSNQSWYAPAPYVQQFATGADTKATADLFPGPAWALAQHHAANDLEALREQYSQVYRNGGEGLALLGVEWYDRELEHPQYINPRKWAALLEITQHVVQMNKVTLPQPDTAVLYASDTYLSYANPKMASGDRPQVYAAYVALGPKARSWFRFVSDRQIDRDQVDLNQFKVLYIPLATYQRRAVMEKIVKFIQQGGTVVCTDPTAFKYDVNGDDQASSWSKITGLQIGDARKGGLAARTVAEDAQRLVFPVPGLKAMLLDDVAKPVAVFDNGDLAATARAVGKGEVIAFAADPFASREEQISVAAFVRRTQEQVGAKTDLDIWRFKLPPFKTIVEPSDDGSRCLTGNSRQANMNVATGATCIFGDAAEPETRLFDRLAALKSRKRGGTRNLPELDKWIVRIEAPEPFDLTIDLKQPRELTRLTLYYSGTLPKFILLASDDGKSWSKIEKRSAQPATADVIDIDLPLSARARYLKISFDQRITSWPLELVELEVWGGDVANVR